MKKIEIIKKFKEAKIKILKTDDLGKLLNISNENTLNKIVERLIKEGILERITKGIFIFSLSPPDDFEIANFLSSPSYISLESALNFYGILIQTPYQITSVTLQKGGRRAKFEYLHVSPQYFFGYEKNNHFLIATKEKALLDEIYFASKGIRKFDFSELELDQIDKRKFKALALRVSYKPTIKLAHKLGFL
jgi:predicted transcriptional regulator of viral defense system